MSTFPAHKLFSIFKGTTFDYPFQFSLGQPGSAAPVNLSGYSFAWTITWRSGTHTYASGATQGSSGVFLGGPTNDLTSGVIDLVIVAADTATLPWTTATHVLTVTTPTAQVYPLIAGGIGVVGYQS